LTPEISSSAGRSYSANWVGQRCRELSERGLLEHDDKNSAYRISDKGRRTAGEEIDADELE
jgi:predicted transcriptional regulator